jgi:hypothetical protein
MTKLEYIKKHKKSFLTDALMCNGWPYSMEIEIISGIESKHNKNSNLYKALKRSTKKEYVTGGKLRYASQGVMIAVA